ncbi:MAG: fliR [Alphaproteobacteria bacterium]|nr:fliR [Alphaproteobacteria bacterium]
MNALPAETAVFLLLFARVGGVLMMLPVFSDESVPAQIRLLIALGMALGLWGLLGPKIPVSAQNALVSTLIAEIMVGLAIGAIVRIMFMAAVMAGALISLNIGLSSALVFDPSQGGQVPLLSKFIAVAAAVVCLSLGVHHLWIGAIVKSYDMFPVGGLPPAADFAQLAIHTVTHAMALALSLAAPLLVYGIVFNAALGLMARLAPAIQIFFIAQPLNLLLGLAILATLFGTILAAFSTEMANFMQAGWS